MHRGAQERLTRASLPVGRTANTDHLVLVPGHAVWLGGSPEADGSWDLAPFQSGEGRAFEGHLRDAVELVALDPRAWLVTSGGCTRPAQPDRSEAQSYLELAADRGWFGRPEVAARATAEPRARDSYENLLFALLAFRERHGRWPRRITVSGWGFKAERFAYHARALGWPVARLHYRGSGDPGDPAAAVRAERATRGCFLRSLDDPELVAKRTERTGRRAERPPGWARLRPERFPSPPLGRN